jgi:hypothetical protein
LTLERAAFLLADLALSFETVTDGFVEKHTGRFLHQDRRAVVRIRSGCRLEQRQITNQPIDRRR